MTSGARLDWPEASHGQLFIDGEWQGAGAAGADGLELVCPANGQPWAWVPSATADDVDRAVRAARRALSQPAWRGSTPDARAQALTRLAQLLREDSDTLSKLETMDTGKPLRETRDQVQAAASWCDYYAALARTLEGRYLELGNGVSARTTLVPSGVVAAMIPANSPLLLTIWKLAPCVAVGNAIVVKPSQEAPVTALRLGRLIERSGLPAGVATVLSGRDAEIAPALLAHPDVDHVSFTGSTAAGRRVAREAAGNGKRVSLELGACNALVIFDDAHLEHAARAVTGGAFVAAGQTCARAARILVQAGSYERVRDDLARRARDIRPGDPMDPATQMGPLRSERLRQSVADAVDGAVERGAALVAGGRPPADPALADGFYWEPTVLADVAPDDEIAQEETFGPVVTIMPFETEREAVALANGTRYGLTAGIWTRDGARAQRVAGELQAGLTWVNTYRRIHWSVPYGGMKASGHARENGVEALREYGSVKAVMVDASDAFPDAYEATDEGFTTHFGHGETHSPGGSEETPDDATD